MTDLVACRTSGNYMLEQGAGKLQVHGSGWKVGYMDGGL